MDRKQHWDAVYAAKRTEELTWFQAEPAVSLALIRRAGVGPDETVLDVGGGTSLLSSFLLDEGFQEVSALDISAEALARAKGQMGVRAQEVEWIEADLLAFDPPRQWSLWHDRAVFHFLTEPEDREAYCRALNRGLEPGGHVIIATFAPDGPIRCSGLEVVRYSPQSLGAVLGSEYELKGSVPEAHETPKGGTQSFVYSWFQRRGKV
jgi:ubiquinone/menaquinone biosynthesis C-methylase UbiE